MLDNFKVIKNREYLGWTIGAVSLVVLGIAPLVVPLFWISLMTEMLILGLAGMSVNLLLGYGGSLPFGHAAFYATGAYASAILIKKVGASAVWALLLSPIVAAAVGAIFGLLVARLYRFYYAMMTTAFSMILWTIIRKWTVVTNGDDGITGVMLPEMISGIENSYFLTLVVVGICIAAFWRIVNSPFGWTLRAIRENSMRMRFASVNVEAHRYVAFILSSFFCGIAGTLYVVYSHSTFPDYAYWVKSNDFVMVCILGGMFSFMGPMVGAAILTLLQTVITSATLYWPLAMGVFICMVVLLMPEGIMGIWNRCRDLLKWASGNSGSSTVK